MKKSILLLWLLLASSGWAQTNLTATGRVRFPNVTLTGFPQSVSATQAPVYTIRWQGANTSGFHMNIVMSAPLTSGARTIASSNLTFTAAGGIITPLTPGSDPGPVETGLTGTLDNSLKVLTSPAPDRGRWSYAPSATNFVLSAPVEAYTGNYTGTLTATLISGP